MSDTRGWSADERAEIAAHIETAKYDSGLEGWWAGKLERALGRADALEDALLGVMIAVNWYHGSGLGPYDERKWLRVLDARDAATPLFTDEQLRNAYTALQPQNLDDLVDKNASPEEIDAVMKALDEDRT